MKPAFSLPVLEPLQNHLTGEPYRLESVDSAQRYSEQVQAIVDICNQPLVYEWIFAQRLGGKPYPPERARQFLAWGEQGWQQQTHFLFLITHQGQVVGACDIKSPDLHLAEVGYWMSALHPGIMTNALKRLCQVARKAGYRKLFAKVKPGNTKSIGVLERAGFGGWEDVVSDGQVFKRCTLELVQV